MSATKFSAVANGIALAAAVLSLSACASLPAPLPMQADGDANLAAQFVHDVCQLPREEREPTLKKLNEDLVPNHAVIYCGRAGL